jgi:hypothetical protein
VPATAAGVEEAGVEKTAFDMGTSIEWGVPAFLLRSGRPKSDTFSDLIRTLSRSAPDAGRCAVR